MPRTAAADPSDDVKLGSSCAVDPNTHMLPAADVTGPSPSSRRPEDPPIPAPAVLFLNFDGGTIEYGPDDAPNNVAWQWSGQYPAYGAGPDRTAALNAVKANYADFNLVVTDTRPASGDYSMIMVGPGMGGGVATLDCDNTSNRNVGFAGHAANDGWGAGTHAALISHEAGHTFGMDHIYNADNIMNPTVYDGARFATSCVDLAGSGCSHDCGSAQNTYDELMAIFGPAAPDEAPPTVAITSPGDGDDLGLGIITITADASDDIGVAEVTLVIDGTSIATRSSEPWSWEADFNEPGMFTLEALARDDWGNETTSNPVTITVGEGGGSGGSGSGGSGSGGSGSGSGGSGSGGGDGGTDGGTDGGYDDGGSGLPPGFGFDEDDGGCGCVTGPRSVPFGWLALAVLGAFTRRRRSTCRSKTG